MRRAEADGYETQEASAHTWGTEAILMWYSLSSSLGRYWCSSSRISARVCSPHPKACVCVCVCLCGCVGVFLCVCVCVCAYLSNGRKSDVIMSGADAARHKDKLVRVREPAHCVGYHVLVVSNHHQLLRLQPQRP